jgi:3-methyladenine DNA glycosylase AlkD
VFISLIPVIKAGATDNRNYVKKAVSWALRNTGKRNPELNTVALVTARELQGINSRSARWIGSDAIRDLTSDATGRRFERMKS